MRDVRSFKKGFICLAVLAFGAPAWTGEPRPEAAHAFKITIASKLRTDAKGVKQTVDASSEIQYTWKSKGSERVLSFDLLSTRGAVDGKETVNAVMTRNKYTEITQGKKQETAIEDAPETLKSLLQDIFESTCKFQVNEDGKEIKRFLAGRPGAQILLDHGMVANALLFHPPFLRAQDKWEAPGEVPLGNGGFVRGTLAYQRDDNGKDRNVYNVSGTLKTSGVKPLNNPLTFKDVRYIVRGQQTYDPGLREWVSGKMVIDVAYELTKGDTVVATASGTMTLTMEHLPPRK